MVCHQCNLPRYYKPMCLATPQCVCMLGRNHYQGSGVLGVPIGMHQSEATPNSCEERRQLQHLLDDIVEHVLEDGCSSYRIRDGKEILFSNMVGACTRLFAQHEVQTPSGQLDYKADKH